MAQIYWDPDFEHRTERGIIGLPVGAIKVKFNDTDTQRLVPFLGAGASLQSSSRASITPPARRPTTEEINNICSTLGISDGSKRFVAIALQFAQLLDGQTLFDEPEDLDRAPSSWQLAKRLAEMLQLEPLRAPAERLRALLNEGPQATDHLDIVRRVAELMGLARSVPQLLTVASYFNVGGRREVMRSKIDERFKNVTCVTPIQQTVAAKAQQFVNARNAKQSTLDKEDYLIITTNYDQLIERQLSECNIPCCVLTVDRQSQVRSEFAKGSQDFLGINNEEFDALKKKYSVRADKNGRKIEDGLIVRAKNFQLTDKSHSIALVYKIHGCPNIDKRDGKDNIIISDQDYVSFIQKNGRNNELVPAYVARRILESRFLFLGYSFADWNVRSLYKQFVRGRLRITTPGDDDIDESNDRDYVVMRSYEESDNYFLQNWDVSILVTELDNLASVLSC